MVQAEPAPFKSEENIEYTSKTENPVLSFLKMPSFVGLIQRPFAAHPDLKFIPLYKLNSENQIKVSPALCRKKLPEILGEINPQQLAAMPIENFYSRSGQACLVHVEKYTDVIIVFIVGKLYGLVIKYDPASSQENIRFEVERFVRGLK
jgi:hypothetical protein